MSRVSVINKNMAGVGDEGEDLYGQADLDTRTVSELGLIIGLGDTACKILTATGVLMIAARMKKK